MTAEEIPIAVAVTVTAFILFGWAFYGIHWVWRTRCRQIVTRISGRALRLGLLFAFSFGMLVLALIMAYITLLGTLQVFVFFFERFDLYALTESVFHMRDRENFAWLAVGMVVTYFSLIYAAIVIILPMALSEVRLRRREG